MDKQNYFSNCGYVWNHRVHQLQCDK